MTRITALGRLTAAEDRTLRGVLLPYGVPGMTNLGRVTAAKGSVTVPADVADLHATLDHLDDRDPVATFAQVEETDDGLVASWSVPKTHGGDKLLAEFKAGIRTGVSVELEPVQIKDGRIVAGTLIGCAFPVEPAFPTARLVASLAPDTEGVDNEDDDDQADEQTTEPAPADPATPPAAPADEDPEEEEEPTMGSTAAAPAGMVASKAGTGPSIKGKADVFRLLAEANGMGSAAKARLLAALSDIVPANVVDMEQPGWLGELWSGSGYARRIVPLVNQASLTSMKVEGWRWVTKPAVARYSGDKSAVPSNTVDTEPVSFDAIRFAGAHDIDRKFRDFSSPGFWSAYYQAMTESYQRQTDDYALEELKQAATVVTAGAVPSGISAGWAAIVDAALAVVEKGAPSFAIVEKSVYRSLLLTPRDQAFEFLSQSMGLTEGGLSGFRIIPVASNAVGDAASTTGLDVGEVLVGTRSAATFHELGGGAPIRAEAIDMVNGGIDAGVFGYAGLVVHDAEGLALVDTDADGV